MTMSDYSHKEDRCLQCFCKITPLYHLWTPENFEIIFRNDAEFRIGMGTMAIAAKCFPDVRILTFELMTNHIHIMAAGDGSRIRQMFEMIKKLLIRMAGDAGRTINWAAFKPGIRQLNDLADARNVLIYDNRNGFLVHDSYTPFSYPWGANPCYFNPDAKKRFQESSIPSTIKDRRLISHSHISDGIQGLRLLDGCFSPFAFCDIETGENIFRDAVHYFYMLGRNIENNKEIAKEIGESISYTEDELYSAVSVKCKRDYGTANPAQIPSNAKIAMAKVMRYEYNATLKQIQRMLRLDSRVLLSIFGSQG